MEEAVTFSQVPSLGLPLAKQIEGIVHLFQDHADRLDAEALLLIGSCSTGQATYRSDVDLLVILRDPPLTYDRVQKLRDLFDTLGMPELPLPVQIQFILPTAFETKEPAMATALKMAIALWEKPGFNFQRRLT